MIFQNTGASLCPTRKIGAQICESVRAHEKRCGFITPDFWGMSGRKSRREIKDMTLRRFADMGLSDGETIWNSYPSSLSGGMNQRVRIALAICCCIRRFFWRTSRRVHSMWFPQAQVLRELPGVAAERADRDGAGDAQSCGSRADGRPGCCFEGWKHRGAGETRTVFDHPKDEYTKSPCGCAGKREERCIIITCWK